MPRRRDDSAFQNINERIAKVNEYSKKDALSPENEGEARDFRVKVRSVTVSLSAHRADDGDTDMPVTARQNDRPEVVSERIETVALASVAEKDGRLFFSYDDVLDEDEAPVTTVLSFETAEPGIVTLERLGFMRVVMIFEQGKRHRATYRMPFGGFEMTIYARRVENALTADGGTLRLEYAVEFRGAAEQTMSTELHFERL